MQISARNQLKGTVKDITLGNVVAEIVVALPDGQIVSIITYHSSEHLKIGIGDAVTVIIKSTDVMLAKEG